MKRVHFVHFFFFFFFFFFCICCIVIKCVHYLFFIAMKRALFEPANGIMVLIEYANSDGSDSPAYPRSLTRAFAIYSIN